MNLLYTATAYPPSTGGAQFYQHLLAQELSRTHTIQVVSQWNANRTDWLLGTTLAAPQQPQDYVIDGIPVHQIGLSRAEKVKLLLPVLAYYPLMHLALPPIANCLERHLLPYARQAALIHNVRIGREGISWASRQLARKLGIPFILTPVHHPRWVGWRYKAFLQLYHAADAVIALTDAEKTILAQLGVPSGRIHVTGMGPVLAPAAAPEQFLAQYQVEAPFVLFLGQHYPYKGFHQVLQAAQIVWRKMPDVQFVFIGPPVGNSEALFEQYRDRRIHRLGRVDLQTKTDALAACSLLCVPSTQESFGGVYTEAWSFARPVIGCPIPAVAEVIADEVDGCLVQQEPAAIAERIGYLLANPPIAQAMGRQGRQKVADRYSWSRLAQLTEGIYRAVLVQGGGDS